MIEIIKYLGRKCEKKGNFTILIRKLKDPFGDGQEEKTKRGERDASDAVT